MTSFPPLTPAQAKEQVIAAVRELVTALGIPVREAWVGLDSCNDQGDGPFRGRAAVHYPAAPSRAEAQEQTAFFLQQLRAAGWECHPPLAAQAPAAEKSGATAVFEVQADSDPVRVITVLGQCRDLTTTKASRGTMDAILDL